MGAASPTPSRGKGPTLPEVAEGEDAARRPVSAPSGRGDLPRHVTRILTITALGNFASSLLMRAIDPMIPQVALDLQRDPATVALLTTAFALPYAALQPVLGPIADMFGKTRLMTICIGILVVNAVIGAAAPNFEVLLATRVATGIAAGGIFPTALAIAGDLVPVHRRQVAVSRLLAAGMMGILLGTPIAGIVGDLLGWRSVIGIIGALCFAIFITALIGFRGADTKTATGLDLTAALRGYRTIFRNPLAKYCFGGVLLEGAFMMGIFPYVAVLQREFGESRATIAGAIIAGFPIGGVFYSLLVSRLLARIGERGLMLGGAGLMGGALFSLALRAPWPVEVVQFMFLGAGFYMLHGVIQIYATELAPEARGSAAAAHSGSFTLGMAIGPIYFGFGLAHMGLTATVAISAAMIWTVGYVCAAKLHRQRPA